MSQTAILHQDSDFVTVQMTIKRWNRIQRLEETYRLANAIRRGLRQAEKAPAMTMDEAIETLRQL